MTNDIIDSFNLFFEMIPADTDVLKKEVYKLRYQVYCIETGFEKIEDHPDGMEIDDYDHHSAHYLIRHRKSGIFAATTRLILPCPDNNAKLYPIEAHTQIDNLGPFIDVPRNNLAEASRFCVSKEFKRRRNEANTLSGIASDWEKSIAEEERRIFPHITIGLFACLIKMSYENDILYWYAVMEPALIRFFASLGMDFIGIGPLADYHGKRRPTIIKVSDLLEGAHRKKPEIWDLLTNRGRYIL